MTGGPVGPDQADVDALRGLLDLMQGFASNDQRARYLLSSNWMRTYHAGGSLDNRLRLHHVKTHSLVTATPDPVSDRS